MLVTPRIERGQRQVRLGTVGRVVAGDSGVRVHDRRGGDVWNGFFRPGNVTSRLIPWSNSYTTRENTRRWTETWDNFRFLASDNKSVRPC